MNQFSPLFSQKAEASMVTRQQYTLSTLPLKTITGSQTTTLGALQHDSQFDIRLEELTTSDTVQEFKAVIFKDSTLVNLGEFIELVTPYDQVHAAAAPILVELTCCIIPLDAVWTSSSYFQRFLWHHTLSCSGLPLMVSHCSMNKTVPC
ncbi:hypothetical protein EMCRGX_G029994 [Ephydatia muelleri]